MRISLVGTNVELEPLRALVNDRALLSPEPMAAAYARISRSPETVEQLRESARTDVESARRSNQRIVFDMGHSSIAEHAVFNFDVEGISRLAVEELERSRLASFTERSQRYVRLDSAWHMPAEVASLPGVSAAFKARYDALFDAYDALHRELLRRQLEGVGGSVSKAERQAMETVAKEDARYVLPLGTLAQLGMTLNARSLESMARRMRGHELEEVRAVAQALEAQALSVAPSLIRYTSPRGLADPSAAWKTVDWTGGGKGRQRSGCGVSLIDPPVPGEPDRVLGERLQWLNGAVEGPHDEALRRWLVEYYGAASPWDSAPRLLEFVELTYEATVSAACFGQLKRHRMASMLAGPYDLRLGVRVPPSLESAGLAAKVVEAAEVTEELMGRGHSWEAASAYLICNSVCRKVIIKMNLRELYHFCRLRMDGHAQWEIRELAGEMAELARGVAPGAAGFLCGKDCFGSKTSM